MIFPLLSLGNTQILYDTEGKYVTTDKFQFWQRLRAIIPFGTCTQICYASSLLTYPFLQWLLQRIPLTQWAEANWCQEDWWVEVAAAVVHWDRCLATKRHKRHYYFKDLFCHFGFHQQVHNFSGQTCINTVSELCFPYRLLFWVKGLLKCLSFFIQAMCGSSQVRQRLWKHTQTL